MSKILGFVACLILLSVVLSGCISTEYDLEDENTEAAAQSQDGDISSSDHVAHGVENQDVSDSVDATAVDVVAAVDPIADHFAAGFEYRELPDSAFNGIHGGVVDGYQKVAFDNGSPMRLTEGSTTLVTDHPDFYKLDEVFYLRHDFVGDDIKNVQEFYSKDVVGGFTEFYKDFNDPEMVRLTAEAEEVAGRDLFNYGAVTVIFRDGTTDTVVLPYLGDTPGVYIHADQTGGITSETFLRSKDILEGRGYPDGFLEHAAENLGY